MAIFEAKVGTLVTEGWIERGVKGGSDVKETR
jgi:hypothetical protein